MSLLSKLFKSEKDSVKQNITTPSVFKDPDTQSSSTVASRFAFAFDIDGVFLRGGEVIPEGVKALKFLDGDNPFGMKVPYIFVTNGGGRLEKDRCKLLSDQFGVEIHPKQLVCSHSPMKDLASQYQTVLAVGGVGERSREIAQECGFKDVVTPGDIIKANEATTPYRSLTGTEHENSRIRDYSQVEVQAILIMSDSFDWASDIQIILDLLTSKNGRIGTKSENCNEGPLVYFGHKDLVWATKHDSPRIGMGAFKASLQKVYKELTGKNLEVEVYGKPALKTFQFASRVLDEWRKERFGLDEPLRTVFFVGDSPNSDVRGTNEFNEYLENGPFWYSILVETGVFNKGSVPLYEPRYIVKDVFEAVKFGIKMESCVTTALE